MTAETPRAVRMPVECDIYASDFSEEGLRLLRALFARYGRRSKAIRGGRNRTVFLMDRYVVKVPRCLAGFRDNDWEGSVSNANDDPEEIRYARTRIAWFDEIPVVFMERVQEATSKDIVRRLGREPDWVMSVDGGQVGFTRDGRLVAFDYGL